jgi:hypothetical protein
MTALLAQIDTETTTNGDISSALLVSTFTNTSRIRKVAINVFADQVAGNGDYEVYCTIQRAGAGSAYKSPVTTVTVASGVTSVVFPSIFLMLNATDVLKTYLKGLAGDDTTPDIIVDVNEELPLADGAIARATFAADMGLMPAGTIGATGNDTTHLHLAGLAYADDAIQHHGILFLDVSTGLYYLTWVTAFANTGDLATVSPALPTPEASVDQYWLLPIRDVGAVKTKTDSLNFTQAGHVDANTQKINDVTILGDGSGTPFHV